MRWGIMLCALAAGFAPVHAYQAASAGPASFVQPNSRPPKSEKKEDPARRALLEKLDADIARYGREGNQGKVDELKKMRAAVESATTDEELAVWARKLNPPKQTAKKPAPAVTDAKPVEAPSEPAVSVGEEAAKTVASTAQSVAENGSDSGGLKSLFDGGESRTSEAAAPEPTPPQAGPVAAAANPIQAPAPKIIAPGVGPGQEVHLVREYPRPKNVPLKWQAPPNPDTEREMSAPASLSELEVLAAQNGIPVGIFRQAYVEARRQNVDYRLVLAVMKQESAFKPHATSGAGARGLMQVMPATGRDLGVKNANMLYDVKTSIYAGTKYIRQMWSMFVDKGAAIVKSFDAGEVSRVKKAVAAYNAGPGNVRKAGGVPRFKETQNYVVKVLGNYYAYMRDFPPAIGPQAGIS